MGLDTVELFMAIEEEFGLHFNDADAADCTTPRHVADYLFKRVRTSSDDPCPTQRGFYKIRKAILSSFDFRREDIAPSTKLSIILGKPEKQSWEKLGQAIATDDLPKLKRSRGFLILVVLGIPIAGSYVLSFIGLPTSILAMAFLIQLVIVNSTTYRFGSEIPSKYNTVGSLVEFVDCSSTKVWSYEEILARVIEITSVQLGVDIREITPNSHFVYDLGAD